VESDTPLPPIPDAPYKETEGLAILEKCMYVYSVFYIFFLVFQKNPNFHLLTHNLLFINDRIMKIHYVPDVGYYFGTRKDSQKVKEIEINPIITLLQVFIFFFFFFF
jgi:hypothetical protein